MMIGLIKVNITDTDTDTDTDTELVARTRHPILARVVYVFYITTKKAKELKLQ